MLRRGRWARFSTGGAELLRAADVDGCDCFLIDQKMPGMSGLELIAKLRDLNVSARRS